MDTSALLALCFHEAGADEVRASIRTGEAWIAAASWLELRVRLGREVEGLEVLAIYETALAGTVAITREVAEAAYEIRHATHPRVPMIDCLIAGAARVHDMRLLHRDRHMATIPARLLKQKMLPSK